MNNRKLLYRRSSVAIAFAIALALGGGVLLPSANAVAIGMTMPPSEVKVDPNGPRLEVGGTPIVTGVPCPESVLRLWDGADHPNFWTPDADAFSYQWLRNGSEIQGENKREYLVRPGDLGAKLSLRLTALRTGWAPTTEMTAEVDVLKCPAPVPAGPLPLSGVISVGTEIAVGGSWDPSLHRHFSWSVGDYPVGKNARAYIPKPSDAGKNIKVFVTAWRDGHVPVVVESITAKVQPGKLKNLAAPYLWADGGVRVGERIYALSGTDAMGSMRKTHQWYRDGKPIPGANKDGYLILLGDMGHVLSAKVTYKQTGYEPVILSTKPSKKVEANALKATKKPSISGTARYASTLKVSKGTWNASPKSHSYQWYRNSKKIKGATHTKYKLVAADIGQKITAKVTVKRPGYKPSSATTKQTKATKAVFKKVHKPKIDGTRKIGHVLTAKPGTTSPKATSFAYQWYRGEKPIKGATKRTYKTVKADKNKRISVKVTAKRKNHRNLSKTSSSVVVSPKPKYSNEDSWEDDYSWDDDYSSGKAPNRCYAPGGRTYTYC